MSDVLYLAIVSDLKEKIAKGIYRPGDMLSSESSLMNEYHAGRMTIRKSLSLLSNDAKAQNFAERTHLEVSLTNGNINYLKHLITGPYDDNFNII